jgi:hypothetical protein
MAVRLSALRTGRALLPKNIIFPLLVLISARRWVNPRAQCGWKNQINSKNSFTRDLSPCSITPQPLCYRVPQMPNGNIAVDCIRCYRVQSGSSSSYCRTVTDTAAASETRRATIDLHLSVQMQKVPAHVTQWHGLTRTLTRNKTQWQLAPLVATISLRRWEA